jgi:malate dehydrogenase (oxaloacetate-decarboxylating)(NADP+)
VINDKGAWFFVDTHVQVDPSAEQIAEATLQAAYRLKLFGIEPKVALLSHSNFGSHDRTPAPPRCAAPTRSSARARRSWRSMARCMADTAWDEPAIRASADVPQLHLIRGRANLLVMPEPRRRQHRLQPGPVRMTDGVGIGPILMGVAPSLHILTPASSPPWRRVVNMTASPRSTRRSDRSSPR